MINGSQPFPSVAMDAGGDFVISWSGHRAGPWNVYAQQYHANGTAAGGVLTVSTPTPGVDQEYSSVAMVSVGDFVVTWSAHEPGPNNWDVYAQRYTTLLGSLQSSGPFLVNTFTPEKQEFPSVAMTSAGNFTTSWASHNQDGNGWGVYGLDFNSSAQPLEGSEYQVNTTTQGDQEFSSVAVDNNGDKVFAWFNQKTRARPGWSLRLPGSSPWGSVVSPTTLQTPRIVSRGVLPTRVVLTSQLRQQIWSGRDTCAIRHRPRLSVAVHADLRRQRDWNMAQTVTVTGLDDLEYAGRPNVSIKGTASSTDDNRDGLASDTSHRGQQIDVAWFYCHACFTTTTDAGTSPS